MEYNTNKKRTEEGTRTTSPFYRATLCYALYVVVCLSVCLTRRYCIETAARIELIFSMHIALDSSYIAY